MKAIQINTLEEADFRPEDGGRLWVSSGGERWCAEEFFRYWRTEGSRGYGALVRGRRVRRGSGGRRNDERRD